MVLLVVAIWGFAEATLFFIVADVPISAIGLRCGWRKARRAALAAALAAGIGGLVVLHFSAAVPQAARGVLLQVPGIDAELLDNAVAAFRDHGFPALAAGAFRGVPYKLYAHGAGIAGDPTGPFFFESIVARLPRFLLVAATSGWIGPRLRGAMPDGMVAALFIACWSAFYAFYFAAMGY